MFPLSTPLPLKTTCTAKKGILQGGDFHAFVANRKNLYNEAVKGVLQNEKTMAIAVLAACIVSLSGRANTDHPPKIQDSSCIEIAASEADVGTGTEEDSDTSVSESKESSADSTVAVKAETESAHAEVSIPNTEPGIAAQMPVLTTVAES